MSYGACTSPRHEQMMSTLPQSALRLGWGYHQCTSPRHHVLQRRYPHGTSSYLFHTSRNTLNASRVCTSLVVPVAPCYVLCVLRVMFRSFMFVPLRGTIERMLVAPDCGRCAPLVRGYAELCPVGTPRASPQPSPEGKGVTKSFPLGEDLGEASV